MHIHALRIKNFRRLKDCLVDLDKDLSIFVGANNSGKTSTAHAMQLFTSASRERVSIHDFNADSWKEIDDFGEEAENASLPTISLDIWFHVEAADVHRVINLLPSLDWQGSLVGMRIEFAAEDEEELRNRFQQARNSA
jgi:predicted ATP-dependent endonuclease of OLD family